VRPFVEFGSRSMIFAASPEVTASVVVDRPVVRTLPRSDEAVARPAAPTATRRRVPRPRLPVFLVSFLVYAAIGYKVVVLQHVVVPDGWSRLAHAYFVYYNDPPKLAAIGFIWPPLMTLVFMPIAWIAPLSTSLAALPLTSAVFGAATVSVLDRLLASVGMRALLRYPVLAAFALNPMVLFYATNGMGEIVSLFLLTLALHALMSWHRTQEVRHLAVLSFALALGFLARYELLLWASAVGAFIAISLIVRRARASAIEASLITYLVPIVYATGLWMFLNWTIVGNPLYWLKSETSSETGVAVAGQVRPSALSALGDVLTLNADVFLPTIVASAALIAVWLYRRDGMAAGICIFLLLNAAFTGLLFYVSGNHQYLELRYNIRPMPAVIAAIAWLFLITKSQRGRNAIWAVSFTLLLAVYPLTWRTMETSSGGFLEDAFVHALPTFDDQTGTTAHVLGSQVRVGSTDERAMARYITHHVHGSDAILTDDAASFAVMLFDGRPGVYLDRIDVGDTAWHRVLARPWGKVGYLLTSPRSAAGGSDLAIQRYPSLLHAEAPGFTRIYGNSRYTLFRVARTNPAAP
jgi:hypothetical protein